HRPWSYRYESRGDGRGNFEGIAVGDLHQATFCLAYGGRRPERKRERIRRSACGSAHRRAVSGQVAGNLSLEDPQIVQWNFSECLSRHAEIFGKSAGRHMSHPVRHQKGVELACCAVIKADDELAPVGAESLQRMRITGREI